MNILLLSHGFYPNLGGIESISEMLAVEFIKAGHRVHVMTWTKSTGSKEFSFKIIRDPNKITILREYLWADIVFENNPCLRLSWPRFFFRRPLVTGLHTWIVRTDGSMGLQDRLKQWLVKNKTTKVIACSNAIRLKCWTKAIVIHNFYKSDLFKILPGIQRMKDFVFLGRLVSDKGADLAIHAVQQLLEKEGINFFLTIIGDGPEKDNLQKLATRLGILKQIRFAGSMQGEELVQCLNQHKYMLVPSKWEEPFGIVVLEGMACGCIPIVSDGGGLPEAVGPAGLIFERGNIRSLVESIKLVINNTELQNKLREAAPQHLSAHTTTIVAEKYLQMLKEISNYSV